MFRRCHWIRYTETPLKELKGIALATLKAAHAHTPRPSTVIVDVREPKELMEDGTIPAAVHIPLGDLDRQLSSHNDAFFQKTHGLPEALNPSKHTLLFSCRSGRRSLTAIDIAEANGFKASHYAGGNNGYQKDPLTDADIEQYLRESSRNASKS
jgi:rhodanese-related sulfurtransferase